MTRSYLAGVVRPRAVVTWDIFVQRVRRHRTSDLLRAISLANIAIAPDGMWVPDASKHVFPWSLAVANRESIPVAVEDELARRADAAT